MLEQHAALRHSGDAGVRRNACLGNASTERGEAARTIPTGTSTLDAWKRTEATAPPAKPSSPKARTLRQAAGEHVCALTMPPRSQAMANHKDRRHRHGGTCQDIGDVMAAIRRYCNQHDDIDQ